MATIDNIVKKTPTLGQVANLIKKRAVALAPKRTGNLKRQLDTYNRPSGMVKQTQMGNKQVSLSFTIDVSPPGAEYGKFWNDPNVSWQVKKGGNPANINFADKAINSPEVQQMIDRLVSETVDGVTSYLKTEVKKIS